MAVAFPALTTLAFGAVELSEVNRERGRLQDAADAAAIMAARELSLGLSNGVKARAEGFAMNMLADVAAKSTVSVNATIDGKQATLDITSNRVGFFANMLPPGGFWSRVKATAGSGSSQPLCVLGLNTSSNVGPTINVMSSASLQGVSCVVHANHNVQVTTTNSVGITAGVVQAVGTATGTISPAAVTGAPLSADPFATREFSYPTCSGENDRPAVFSGPGPHKLYPKDHSSTDTNLKSPHCAGIQVEDETTLELEPGVHYFENGHLTLSNTSRLTGTNVVLVFGPSSKLKAQGRSYVSLTGRESAPNEGMVLMSTPTNTLPFEIFSSSVDRLEGVIYLPNANLLVNGATVGGKIAEHSDWTVTVTKQLKIDGHAQLVIRSDYAASTVPVPSGLGISGGAGDVRLLQNP